MNPGKHGVLRRIGLMWKFRCALILKKRRMEFHSGATIVSPRLRLLFMTSLASAGAPLFASTRVTLATWKNGIWVSCAGHRRRRRRKATRRGRIICLRCNIIIALIILFLKWVRNSCSQLKNVSEWVLTYGCEVAVEETDTGYVKSSGDGFLEEVGRNF